MRNEGHTSFSFLLIVLCCFLLSSSGERERRIASWIWIRFSEEAEQKTGFVLRVHGVQLKCRG